MNLLVEDAIIKNNTEVLKEKLRTSSFHSSKVPLFIFVCGKQILGCEGEPEENLLDEGNKRGLIVEAIKELSSKRPIFSIVAEQLLSVELAQKDSLTFEGLIADLSDEIVLIIESPGTICELGAFSFSNKINKKIFVLNDLKYEKDNSFINRGPIKKLSGINPNNVHYVDYNMDWKNITVLQDYYNRVKNIKREYAVGTFENDIYNINIKDLIIEILAIIEIYQPIVDEHVHQLYKFLKGKYKIKSDIEIKNVKQVVELLCEIGILQNGEDGVRKNYRSFPCASCVFDLSEEQINNIRAKILCRIRRKTNKRR